MALKDWSIAILIFAGGLALGGLGGYKIVEIIPSKSEKEFSQQRIKEFQDKLGKVHAPEDADALKQQIDLQLKFEELRIQSRAAEYSNLTPFTSFSSSVVTAVIGLLGIVIGAVIGKKHGVGKKHGGS